MKTQRMVQLHTAGLEDCVIPEPRTIGEQAPQTQRRVVAADSAAVVVGGELAGDGCIAGKVAERSDEQRGYETVVQRPQVDAAAVGCVVAPRHNNYDVPVDSVAHPRCVVAGADAVVVGMAESGEGGHRLRWPLRSFHATHFDCSTSSINTK